MGTFFNHSKIESGFKLSLAKKLTKDMIAAMKANDKQSLSVIRMLKSELTNKKISVGHDLKPDEETAVVTHEVKQHKESIAAFKKGGRDDLVKQQEAQLKVINRYAPQPMSQADVKKLVTKTVQAVGASSMKDFGKVMGAVMSKSHGRINGSVVNRMVKKMLNK